MDGEGIEMVIIINLISGAVGLQCSVVTIIIVIVAHAPAVVHKCRRGKSLLSNFHVGQENGFQSSFGYFVIIEGVRVPGAIGHRHAHPSNNEYIMRVISTIQSITRKS